MSCYQQVYNIEISEETDYFIQFLYNNLSTGLPQNLTGYRAECQVRRHYSGETNGNLLALDFTTTTGGGIVLGGTAGTIQWSIPYTATQNTDWYQGSYSMILIDPTSLRIPFVKGLFTIIRSNILLKNTSLPDITTGSSTLPNNQGLGGISSLT